MSRGFDQRVVKGTKFWYQGDIPHGYGMNQLYVRHHQITMLGLNFEVKLFSGIRSHE